MAFSAATVISFTLVLSMQSPHWILWFFFILSLLPIRRWMFFLLFAYDINNFLYWPLFSPWSQVAVLKPVSSGVFPYVIFINTVLRLIIVVSLIPLFLKKIEMTGEPVHYS